MREEEMNVSPDDSPHLPRPGLWKLAALLTGVALVFSYLGAFAVTNALITTELIEHWAPGADPRPRWMIKTFICVMSAFAAIALLFQWSGRRQMRQIDAIDEADLAPEMQANQR